MMMLGLLPLLSASTVAAFSPTSTPPPRLSSARATSSMILAPETYRCDPSMDECIIEDVTANNPLKTYTEISRPYRRTVYGHDEWVKHRSSLRFAKNLATTFESGVVRSLASEIILVSTIAALVVGANMGISGYDDLAGVHHAAPFPITTIKELSLPAMPFTIAMPALSLLLVFRTNTAYSRWNEARTLWGGIVNTCRNLGRQANSYFPEDEEGQALRAQLNNQAACFPKALRSFLRGPEDDETFRKEATELLGAATAEAIMASKNRQTFVANLMTATVVRANIEPMARARMDESVSKLVDYLGACERIFRSPIPLVYTRHTSRFITSFLMLLPFAIWPTTGSSWNHLATIPATAILASFLFGIEELGIQIEEPFGILPLEALCDGSIETVVMDMKSSYEEGQFGSLHRSGEAEIAASAKDVEPPAAEEAMLELELAAVIEAEPAEVETEHMETTADPTELIAADDEGVAEAETVEALAARAKALDVAAAAQAAAPAEMEGMVVPTTPEPEAVAVASSPKYSRYTPKWGPTPGGDMAPPQAAKWP